MFDYVNKLQLALGDKARRTGLKIGAGVVVLIGAGFLTAALWSWLVVVRRRPFRGRLASCPYPRVRDAL